jgi:hypothetical protein
LLSRSGGVPHEANCGERVVEVSSTLLFRNFFLLPAGPNLGVGLPYPFLLLLPIAILKFPGAPVRDDIGARRLNSIVFAQTVYLIACCTYAALACRCKQLRGQLGGLYTLPRIASLIDEMRAIHFAKRRLVTKIIGTRAGLQAA